MFLAEDKTLCFVNTPMSFLTILVAIGSVLAGRTEPQFVGGQGVIAVTGRALGAEIALEMAISDRVMAG